MKMTLDPLLAAETKAMVALAFRNGPIEALHAGKQCPACAGSQGTSHISDEEMKTIMKSAVDTLYRLLWQRENDSKAYLENLALGSATPCAGMNQNSRNPEERDYQLKVRIHEEDFQCSKNFYLSCATARCCSQSRLSMQIRFG
jgi:hypothetical protein